MARLARPRRFLRDVQELADRDLAPHRRVLATRAGRAPGFELGERIFEEVVRPGDQEVAQKEGAGSPERAWVSLPPRAGVVRFERPVRRGVTAPRVRVVDDVVVHQGCGVEDLERRGCRQHVLGHRAPGCRGVGDGAPSGDAEPGTEALPAGDGGGPGVDDEGRLVSPRVRIAALSRDERIQSLGNHLGEVWSR